MMSHVLLGFGTSLFFDLRLGTWDFRLLHFVHPKEQVSNDHGAGQKENKGSR